MNRNLRLPRGASGRELRLSTLVGLRWLAVAGQAVAILIVGMWFGFPLPLAPAFALIALSALVNVALRSVFPPSHRLGEDWAAGVLAYDVLQLAGLLYLTGGLENPFAILFLVPVMVSATLLQPDRTFLLGGLVFVAATILAFLHEPLPWFPGEAFTVPLLYVGGVWIALVSTLVFMAFYAFRVAEEARQLADALSATELVLAREQHLSALDGLAAAAAHELGTPLATIHLVANELESELAPGDAHAEDVRLIRSQSQRCREILAKITSLSSAPGELLGRMPLTHMIEDVTAPHRDFGVEIVIDTRGEGPEPVAERNAGLLHGLGNIVENAVDFASSRVEIVARWDARSLSLTVADDGPGFSPDILDRIGEPYVTTRRAGVSAPTREQGGGEHGGMGLGFFIAKTLLERSGARLTIGNRAGAVGGAVVTIVWPRPGFDAAVGESAARLAPAAEPVFAG